MNLTDISDSYFENRHSPRAMESLRLKIGDFVTYGGEKYELTTVGNKYAYMVRPGETAAFLAKVKDLSKWIDVQEIDDSPDNFNPEEYVDDFQPPSPSDPDLFEEIKNKMQEKMNATPSTPAQSAEDVMREQIRAKLNGAKE